MADERPTEVVKKRPICESAGYAHSAWRSGAGNSNTNTDTNTNPNSDTSLNRSALESIDTRNENKRTQEHTQNSFQHREPSIGS